MQTCELVASQRTEPVRLAVPARSEVADAVEIEDRRRRRRAVHRCLVVDDERAGRDGAQEVQPTPVVGVDDIAPNAPSVVAHEQRFGVPAVSAADSDSQHEVGFLGDLDLEMARHDPLEL